MEDGTSSGLESYSAGTVVWVKLPRFSWWPAEVVGKTLTEDNVTKELHIETYGDDENEKSHDIRSSKMIQMYECSARKELTDKGRKKYQSKPFYRNKFDVAIKIANKKVGIEEVMETVEQNGNQDSPQVGNFEIKRKNLTSDSNYTSNDCSFNKETTPLRDVEQDNNRCMDFASTDSGSATNHNTSNDNVLLTPTRKAQSRSVKRSRTDSKLTEKAKTKKMRQSSSSHASSHMTNNDINNDQVTPCNSSGIESEDDLPAVSMSQTPIKCYSSLKDVQSKDLVWVKHGKDPFWPALVMKDGNSQRVVINFFAYEGPEYTVKNKKKILPYFCVDKEKFEEKSSTMPDLREACNEALWLLRSGKKECGDTAFEQFEAIKKRRSLSQVTPCKRLTLTEDESSQSSDDEPMESAFGYDITNSCGNSRKKITRGNGEESPETEIISDSFPKGSPYSFEVLKENFLLFEKELYSIFKGEIDSENHRIFFQGTAKERNKIKIQNRCGPLLHLHIDHWKELQDTMVSWVKEWSKLEDKEVHEVQYVSDVLFPEATVRTIMKIEHLKKGEAWEIFLALDSTE